MLHCVLLKLQTQRTKNGQRRRAQGRPEKLGERKRDSREKDSPEETQSDPLSDFFPAFHKALAPFLRQSLTTMILSASLVKRAVRARVDGRREREVESLEVISRDPTDDKRKKVSVKHRRLTPRASLSSRSQSRVGRTSVIGRRFEGCSRSPPSLAKDPRRQYSHAPK